MNNFVITIDVGNTNIVVGCFRGYTPEAFCRLETHHDWTAEELESELRDFMERQNIICSSDAGAVHSSVGSEFESSILSSLGPEFEGSILSSVVPEFEGSILSSVVPELNGPLQKAMESLTGQTPLVMSPNLESGIKTEKYDLSLLGADRIVDMAAAVSCYGAPAAVWDLGTATTLSVVNRNHVFIGGMISAGVQLGLDSLASRTAQLPSIQAQTAETLLGLDTKSNMISGSAAATGIMIEGIASRLEKLPDMEGMHVILTGGHASLVLPWIDREVISDPDLLSKGLLEIYYRNRR